MNLTIEVTTETLLVYFYKNGSWTSGCSGWLENVDAFQRCPGDGFGLGCANPSFLGDPDFIPLEVLLGRPIVI
jgi:hypothetical protein